MEQKPEWFEVFTIEKYEQLVIETQEHQDFQWFYMQVITLCGNYCVDKMVRCGLLNSYEQRATESGVLFKTMEESKVSFAEFGYVLLAEMVEVAGGLYDVVADRLSQDSHDYFEFTFVTSLMVDFNSYLISEYKLSKDQHDQIKHIEKMKSSFRRSYAAKAGAIDRARKREESKNKVVAEVSKLKSVGKADREINGIVANKLGLSPQYVRRLRNEK